MARKNYTKEEREFAWACLQEFRGKSIMAQVNSVSRSGMSRRIEFYSVDKEGRICRIGYHIAKIVDYPYSVDKGGILVTGCGMDMRFSILSNFNYAACAMDNPGMDFKAQQEKFGRIYDTYFFNADRIES